MKGKAETSNRLTPRQEKALLALCSCATVAAAASASNISQVTLFRWLQLPLFQRRFREMRGLIVERALAELQSSCGEAVEALRRNLTCGAAPTEVRAALGIISQSIRAVELIDLAERIERLEQLQARTEKGLRSA